MAAADMTTGEKVTMALATVGLVSAAWVMRPESAEEKAYYASQRRRNPPTSLISDWWK